MPVMDVYLLALHEPYQAPEHPVPINATVVHAASLLHPAVPQPDGGRIYRCLTEFPGRTPGCVVPLSTLTYELDGGRLWPQVGDWEDVVNAVVALGRARGCDAMPLGLPQVAATLLAQGPMTSVTFFNPDRSPAFTAGPVERQHHLQDLASRVQAMAAQAPFWPGEGLTTPSGQSMQMLYQPLSG